jgi:beta-lactam-binding protein with PASTA domain
MRFKNLDLETIEGYVGNHLRLFTSMVTALLILMGIIAVSVFFISVRGAEQTMVPDVRNMDLTTALLELQVRELYPRIQLRFSQSSADKGLILEQEPYPGTIVKAGRRIRLVVSQGPLINVVENYLGRNVDDVRMDLQTLFASEGGTLNPHLLTLKEPLMYEHSPEPPGTILQQRPEPGSGLSGPTVLELVVSLGAEDVRIRLPDFLGLSPEDALEQIGRSGIDFFFTLRSPLGEDKPGTVVSQDPSAGTMIPIDTRVNITIATPPHRDNGVVFGIFRYDMGKNPYPLSLRLEAQFPSGEKQRLLSTEYAGGPLTVPYNLPLGTVLILSLLNREIHRETVVPLVETLYLDQL